MHIKKAKVEFTTAGKDVRRTEFVCREVLWDSPRGELDATLVALHPEPTGIPPLSLSDKRPEANKSRVIVVGHPGGFRELCVSLYESPLVQIGSKLTEKSPKHEYLHYTNPTIGGNSGSPVFEDGDWEVVGLHHSGPNLQTNKLPRLDDESGEHSVNEGIYIRSICETAAKEASGRTPLRSNRHPCWSARGRWQGKHRRRLLPSPLRWRQPSKRLPKPFRGSRRSASSPTTFRRRMSALITRVVSVSLSRLLSEKLVADLGGGATAVHDVTTYAAMTVRLKAPARRLQDRAAVG